MPEKAEATRLEVKRQLRKAHPKWDDKKIESVSYAIVTASYKRKGKEAPFNR